MQFAHALAASMLCAVAASGAATQTYPNRPITLVVAFAPGGADDATARILQDPMQKALGQPIVVENGSGDGGMIAAAKGVHAHHDGYTILLHQDALAAGMTLYLERTFDTEKDFAPIGLVNTTTNTLAGRPSLPLRCRRHAAGQFRQAQGLCADRQEGLRRSAAIKDHGRARLSKGRYRFLAYVARPRCDAAADHGNTEPCAASGAHRCQAAPDVQRRRHGSIS